MWSRGNITNCISPWCDNSIVTFFNTLVNMDSIIRIDVTLLLQTIAWASLSSSKQQRSHWSYWSLLLGSNKDNVSNSYFEIFWVYFWGLFWTFGLLLDLATEAFIGSINRAGVWVTFWLTLSLFDPLVEVVIGPDCYTLEEENWIFL